MGQAFLQNGAEILTRTIQGAEQNPTLGELVDLYGAEEAVQGSIDVIQGNITGAAQNFAGVVLGKLKAAKKVVERVRHFTNKNGIEGIRGNEIIKASDQNSVFTVKAKGKVGSARDIEKQLGIKRGRGNNFVEFDANPNEFKAIKNPVTGAVERVFKGDVNLKGRNATFNKNR